MSMKLGGWIAERQIGACLVLILAAPTLKAAMPRQDKATLRQEQTTSTGEAQQVGVDGSAKATLNSTQADANLPDAPEVAQAQMPDPKGQGSSSQPIQDQQQNDANLPDAPEVAQAQMPDPKGQSSSSQPIQDQQQNDAARPVGTAAAPSITRTGVTASKPAGAAIAPAKQRRVRTILISLGIVAAAGIAVGAVAGLSHTSPSQPK